MPKFLFVYHGGDGTVPSTPEEQEAAMTAWRDWMADCGPALINPGEGVKKSYTVTKSGVTEGATNAAFGFSIVETKTAEDAYALAAKNPMVVDGGNVEVAEIMDMDM